MTAELTIEATALTSLDDVAALPQLRSLRIIGCPLADITALTRAQQLEHLELLFTFVEDLSPIAELPNLRTARVLGSPLTETGVATLRARSRARLELGRRDDRERARTAWAGGMRIVAAVLDGVRPMCVRPGATANGKVDVLSGDPVTLVSAVHFGVTTDVLHGRLMDAAAAAKATTTFLDLASHRTFGDATAARGWIDDAAAELGADADRLRTFVARFPSAVFFREDAYVHDAWAYAEGRPIPLSVARIRRVLAGAWADELTEFRVDGSDLAYSIKHPLWPAIEMPGLRDQVDAKRFALAIVYDDFATTLGVARGTAKKAGSPAVLTWQHGAAKPTTLYPSVADFYAHISTLILDDGTRIEKDSAA